MLEEEILIAGLETGCAEALYCPLFDLSDAFSCEVEDIAEFEQGFRLLVIEAVSQADDLLFSFRQVFDGFFQVIHQLLRCHFPHGIDAVGIADEVFDDIPVGVIVC